MFQALFELAEDGSSSSRAGLPGSNALRKTPPSYLVHEFEYLLGARNTAPKVQFGLGSAEINKFKYMGGVVAYKLQLYMFGACFPHVYLKMCSV